MSRIKITKQRKVSPIVLSVLGEHYIDKGAEWCAIKIHKEGGPLYKQTSITKIAWEFNFYCKHTFRPTVKDDELLKTHWPDKAKIVRIWSERGHHVFEEMVHTRAIKLGIIPDNEVIVRRKKFNPKAALLKLKEGASTEIHSGMSVSEFCRLPW